MHRQNSSISCSRAFSLVLALLLSAAAFARQDKKAAEADTIPMFGGVQVSVDLVGPAMRIMGDYGEYEAAARVNIHNRWFPVVEIGYGSAERTDIATENYYKTSAPYFRLGIDYNLLKNKGSSNHIYGGIRYAYTSYKVDIARTGLADPVWGMPTSCSVSGDGCNQSWLEAVLGIDAKVFGPLHLGWVFRYKRRLSHKDSSIGNTWYVPGYGIYGDTRLGASFLVTIDI